jgi:hypothetical protein
MADPIRLDCRRSFGRQGRRLTDLADAEVGRAGRRREAIVMIVNDAELFIVVGIRMLVRRPIIEGGEQPMIEDLDDTASGALVRSMQLPRLTLFAVSSWWSRPRL